MGSLHAPLWLRVEYTAFSVICVCPPFAVSDPTSDNHFNPPRRKAREVNLRIRAAASQCYGLGRRGALSDVRHDAQAGVPSAK